VTSLSRSVATVSAPRTEVTPPAGCGWRADREASLEPEEHDRGQHQEKPEVTLAIGSKEILPSLIGEVAPLVAERYDRSENV
jgi:hypothetical protein